MDGLTGSAGQRLVLDLTGLDECDSSGISALLSARSLAIDQGGGIALVARGARQHHPHLGHRRSGPGLHHPRGRRDSHRQQFRHSLILP
ncbi:STAS domain-containing protein [Streptomyces sp. NPDC056242]|uniref:STAS domain-containing protein n=1 Tax=Streptomyces sp. NPDC056242 TaxID=3345760 RepID=UPI0035E2B4F5